MHLVAAIWMVDGVPAAPLGGELFQKWSQLSYATYYGPASIAATISLRMLSI